MKFIDAVTVGHFDVGIRIFNTTDALQTATLNLVGGGKKKAIPRQIKPHDSDTFLLSGVAERGVYALTLGGHVDGIARFGQMQNGEMIWGEATEIPKIP